MDTLLRDIWQAGRSLRKSGGVTLVAVTTLAIGVAAITAIFSVANAALLHPLPFRDEARLLRLYDARRRENGQVARVSVSARNFFAVWEQAQSFESLAAQVCLDLSFQRSEGPEHVVGIGVSDAWLVRLGVRPLLGRNFSAQEEKAGENSRVTLLSYGAWGRRFGFAPDILGRGIVLNRHSYSIIGILPRGFSYPYHPEVWLPRTFDPGDGRVHTLNVQARLRPGVTLLQARAELQAIAARLQKQYPDTNSGNRIEAEPVREVLLAGQQTVVKALFAAVGLVLLLAVANVVNLTLARFVGRQGEFAIRAALGASPARQVRLLLTENILQALAGGGGPRRA
jgi:putative ABC transport system permease protein